MGAPQKQQSMKAGVIGIIVLVMTFSNLVLVNSMPEESASTKPTVEEFENVSFVRLKLEALRQHAAETHLSGVELLHLPQKLAIARCYEPNFEKN